MLVIVAGLNSVISLFYYFRVAKSMFLTEPQPQVPMRQHGLASILCVLAVATVLTGIGAFKDPLRGWADEGPASLEISAADEAFQSLLDAARR